MNPYVLYEAPPYDAVMPMGYQALFTILFALIAAGFWVHAVRVAKNERDLMPIWLMLGGTLCVMAEPIVDVLGMCWFPVEGQWTYYETFGRKIPLMVGLAYMFYFGGLSYVTVRQFERGMSAVQVWKWYLILTVLEWTIEPIPIVLGMWMYYGEQPFTLFGFPMWWPPVNAVGAFTIAVVIYHMRRNLPGLPGIVYVPMVVSADLVGNAFVAWPVWTALHTTQGTVVTSIAGVVTLALCALAVHIIAKYVSAGRGLKADGISPSVQQTL